MIPASFPLKGAAEYLRCSVTTVEMLIKEGELRCHSLTDGGDRRISRWQIDAFIERREQIGIVQRKSA